MFSQCTFPFRSAAAALLGISGLLCSLSAAASTVEAFTEAYQQYQERLAAGDTGGTVASAEKAWRMARDLYGDDHANTEMLRYNYAVALLDGGAPAHAIEPLNELEKAFAQRYGKASVEWIAIMIDLGNAYAASFPVLQGGRDAIANSVFKEAIRQAEKLYGADSLDVGLLTLQAGQSLADRARSTIARESLTRAQELISQHPKATLEQRALADFAYGKFLVEIQDYEDGIRALQAALPGLRSIPSLEDRWLAAQAGLVTAYESLGQREQATRHCLAIGAAIPRDPDRKAYPLYKKAPRFPYKRVGSAAAFIRLEFEIDEAGFARNPRVIHGQEETAYAQAALDAVVDWRFAPAFVDGRPTTTTAWQDITFVRR